MLFKISKANFALRCLLIVHLSATKHTVSVLFNCGWNLILYIANRLRWISFAVFTDQWVP